MAWRMRRFARSNLNVDEEGQERVEVVVSEGVAVVDLPLHVARQLDLAV
jgi:hypothetical protein